MYKSTAFSIRSNMIMYGETETKYYRISNEKTNWKELVLYGKHSIWSTPEKKIKKWSIEQNKKRIIYLYVFYLEGMYSYQFPSIKLKNEPGTVLFEK